MLTSIQQEKITKAYLDSKLKVASVSPGGSLEWKRVLSVHRAEVSWETLFEVSTKWGSSVLTGGHRIFKTPVIKKDTENFQAGSIALGVQSGLVSDIRIDKVKKTDSRPYMYDLTAEDWHNFVLHKSKIVVSNSPDRNYHFRPPTHEETIQQFSRVFGYIWEDIEMQEYLLRSLDMISASPPRTPFSSIDQMVAFRPEWRTLLLTGAMMHALQALRINWIADEFNYSIGGVSLDLDKSSKYESAYQAASEQFEKQLTQAKLTINVVKGLQQPRFGMGVRSAFGPFVGRGVLSPRRFM